MKLAGFFGLDVHYLRNIGWQSSGNISSQVINIASMPVITRLFGPAELGIFSIFMQAMAVTTIVISCRVEHVIMLPRTDRRARELAMFVVHYGAIASAVLTMLVVSLILLEAIPPIYRTWAMVLPVAAYLLVFAQAMQQLSQRSSDFRLSGWSEIVNRSANSLTAITAGLAAFGGFFLGIAVAVGLFSKALVFRSYFGFMRRNLVSGARRGIQAIRRQALGRLLMSLIVSHGFLTISSIAPLAYITHQYGAEFTGHFSLVLSTIALPTTLIGNAVGQVFYQRASKLFAEGQGFRGLLLANAKLLVLIALPSFSITAIFGPFLYPFVFGPDWELAGQVARIYAIAAALSFMSVPFDRSGLIVNASWYGPIWHLARLASVLLTILLVDRAGGSFLDFMTWLTVQSCCLYLVDGLASFLFSNRTTPFSTRLFRLHLT